MEVPVYKLASYEIQDIPLIKYIAEKKKPVIFSTFVVKDVKAGDLFTEENIRVIRPGQGMEPKFYESIMGKKARVDIKRGTPLKRELII
jgi:sialic acid synthase SpsE